MDNINGEPMVTITLAEYNKLRDNARRQDFIFERLSVFENRLMEMNHKIMDLDIKKANK